MSEDHLKELEKAIQYRTSLPFVAFNEILNYLPRLIAEHRELKRVLNRLAHDTDIPSKGCDCGDIAFKALEMME